MIVVSDTTPLNYLILIDVADVLPTLFGRVYAPSAVLTELSHPRGPEAVQAWAASPPGWLTVQDPARTDPALRLGPGKSAAIALAAELRADFVLMDERRGTRAAERRGLRVAGALVIMQQAGARGLLDYEATRDRLVDETSFYVTDDVLWKSGGRFRELRRAREQARGEERERDEPELERWAAEEKRSDIGPHGQGKKICSEDRATLIAVSQDFETLFIGSGVAILAA
jgi:predicted nucleic acid-binding protein